MVCGLNYDHVFFFKKAYEIRLWRSQRIMRNPINRLTISGANKEWKRIVSHFEGLQESER